MSTSLSSPWAVSPPERSALDVLGRCSFWVLAMGLLALALFRLGGAPLFDVDEGAFSEATREMLASGDWLRTTLNGEPRWDKPIGVYWLQLASVLVFGLSEFALRLPSALSSWGWALAVVWFAAPRFGRAVALSAGCMVATSLGVLLIGRAATADALLNFLLTLAALDAWRWLEQRETPGRGVWPLRRAFAFMGMGLLVKGPVALLVPGGALLVWLAASAWQARDGRGGLARLGQAMADGWAWVALVLIAVPWYVYILNRFGQEFIDGFIVKHNLARYSTPLEQHGGSLGYYFIVLPVLLLPWSPLLVSVLRQVRGLWADPLSRYLLGWGGFVLVFFSLSGTKLPHYVLYGATPFLLLMAGALTRTRPVMRWVLALGNLLLLGLAFGPAVSLPWWVDRVAHPFYQALLAGQSAPLWLGVCGVAVALLVLGLLLWPSKAVQNQPESTSDKPLSGSSVSPESSAQPAGTVQPWGQAQRPALAALASSAALLGAAVPWWGDLLQGPVKQAAEVAREHPGPGVQWQVQLSSFSVYREARTPRRAPQIGELVLYRVDQRASLTSREDGRLEHLFESRGVALGRWVAR